MINKVLFISLFVFILVIISYLYLCYPMSLDLANYLNTYLKIEYGTSKDVLISFIILGFPVYLYHKLGHIIMSLFFFVVYRTYYLIRPMECHTIAKSILVIAISYVYSSVSLYILKIAQVEDTTTDATTIIKMCDAYNLCIEIVFYSLIFILIFFTILYIISIIKKDFHIFELIL